MRVVVSVISLLKGEAGVSSVEYALLLAIIGAGLVAAVGLLGTNVSNRMTTAAGVVH